MIAPTTVTDHDLLQAWAEGNEQAYSDLVARYQGLVRAVCRRHCPSLVADDVAQAVFLVLARRPDQALQAPTVSAWLVRTAWLISQQARRKEDTRRHREHQAVAGAERQTSEASADDSEVLEAVDDALNELPERQRIAVTLQFVVGHSQVEIARQLGLQSNAVKQLIHRGIANLRSHLRRRGVSVPVATLAAMYSAAVARAADSAQGTLIAPSALANNYVQAQTLAGEFVAQVAKNTLLVRVAALATASLTVVGSLALWLALTADIRPPPATAVEPPVPNEQPVLLTPIAGDDRTPVGRWTVFSQLDISGNQAFTTQHLRAAIATDDRIRLAAHARAPRGAFLRILGERVAAGYHNSGYPLARVETGMVDDRAALRINEGPHCVAGDVDITGLTITPPAELIAALADDQRRHTTIARDAAERARVESMNSANPVIVSKQVKIESQSTYNEIPESMKAPWIRGGPVSTSPESLERIGEAVAAWYESHGQVGARCTATVDVKVPEAILRLSIIDQGKPMRLGRTKWQGLERNDGVALEAAIGLTPGMPVTSDLGRKISAWLTDSGRFTTNGVTLSQGKTGVDVAITVRENAYAPGFPEPVGEASEAIFRFSRWINEQLTTGDADLVFTNSDSWGSCTFIQSKSDSVFSWRLKGVDRPSALWKQGNSVTLYHAATNQVVTGHVGSTCTVLSFIPSISDEGKENFSVKMEVKASSNDGAPGLQLDLPPAALLGLLSQEGWTTAVLPEGRLLVQHANFSIELEIATGRPLAMLGTQDGRQDEVTWVPHAARDAIANFSSAASRAEPLDANQNPLAALDAFTQAAASMFGAVKPSESRSFQRAAAGFSLFTHAMKPRLAMLQDVLGSPQDAPKFSMPQNDSLPSGTMVQLIGKKILCLASSAVTEAIPYDAWPNVVIRSVLATLDGHTEYVKLDIQDLGADEHLGPLGCLVVAELLQREGSVSVASAFAGIGIGRMDERRFLDDIRLFQPAVDDLVASCFAHPEKLLTLVAERDQDTSGLSALVKLLKSQSTVPTTDTVASLLWNQGLKATIQERLNQLWTNGRANPPTNF